MFFQNFFAILILLISNIFLILALPTPELSRGNSTLSVKNPLNFRHHKNFGLLPTFQECGISWGKEYQTRFRRTNGRPAGRGKYLMVVRIDIFDRLHLRSTLCTGSLINKRYVLTAGHCLDNIRHPLSISYAVISFGIYNSDRWKECTPFPPFDCSVEKTNQTMRRVQGYKVHEDFTTNLDNDIALIRLDTDVEFTSFVKPVCLPTDESLLENWEDQTVSAVGWGVKTSYHDKEKTYTTRLGDVNLAVVPNTECDKFSSMFDGNSSDSKICTHGENGMDTCAGDSGGPLIKNVKIPKEYGVNGTRQVQIGVTSGGVIITDLGCGHPGVPTLSTNVFKFMPWILDNIEP